MESRLNSALGVGDEVNAWRFVKPDPGDRVHATRVREKVVKAMDIAMWPQGWQLQGSSGLRLSRRSDLADDGTVNAALGLIKYCRDRAEWTEYSGSLRRSMEQLLDHGPGSYRCEPFGNAAGRSRDQYTHSAGFGRSPGSRSPGGSHSDSKADSPRGHLRQGFAPSAARHPTSPRPGSWVHTLRPRSPRMCPGPDNCRGCNRCSMAHSLGDLEAMRRAHRRKLAKLAVLEEAARRRAR